MEHAVRCRKPRECSFTSDSEQAPARQPLGDARTSDNDSLCRAGLSINKLSDLSIDQRNKNEPRDFNDCRARMPQFRSLRNFSMLNIAMRKSPVATKTAHASNSRNKEGAPAAELALKAHILGSNPEILAEMAEGDKMMREIADMVDLTEAPEDAVCGLVTDLLKYCEREKIDWTQEVMLRAWKHVRSDRAYEVQKR